MNGKIIRTEWRSGIDSVCIVAVEYKHYKQEYWQAYIGASRNISEMMLDGEFGLLFKNTGEPESYKNTERRTANHGCKLSWQEAQAFFPTLDITKYKTYPKEK